MTRTDQKILFTALGFTVVVLQGTQGDDGAARAQEFARLIEEFCRVTLPDFAVQEPGQQANQSGQMD